MAVEVLESLFVLLDDRLDAFLNRHKHLAMFVQAERVTAALLNDHSMWEVVQGQGEALTVAARLGKLSLETALKSSFGEGEIE